MGTTDDAVSALVRSVWDSTESDLGPELGLCGVDLLINGVKVATANLSDDGLKADEDAAAEVWAEVSAETGLPAVLFLAFCASALARPIDRFTATLAMDTLAQAYGGMPCRDLFNAAVEEFNVQAESGRSDLDPTLQSILTGQAITVAVGEGKTALQDRRLPFEVDPTQWWNIEGLDWYSTRSAISETWGKTTEKLLEVASIDE